MGFSTKECAWSQTRIKVLGRTLVGINGFEFNKKVDKEAIYGAGDEPLDIQPGNKSYTGNLDLKKYEVDVLNKAAKMAGYEDITEVPHEAIVITCTYKKNATDAPATITSLATAFTDLTASMKQNDKEGKLTLPFISMKIVYA